MSPQRTRARRNRENETAWQRVHKAFPPYYVMLYIPLFFGDGVQPNGDTTFLGGVLICIFEIRRPNGMHLMDLSDKLALNPKPSYIPCISVDVVTLSDHHTCGCLKSYHQLPIQLFKSSSSFLAHFCSLYIPIPYGKRRHHPTFETVMPCHAMKASLTGTPRIRQDSNNRNSMLLPEGNTSNASITSPCYNYPLAIPLPEPVAVSNCTYFPRSPRLVTLSPFRRITLWSYVRATKLQLLSFSYSEDIHNTLFYLLSFAGFCMDIVPEGGET